MARRTRTDRSIRPSFERRAAGVVGVAGALMGLFVMAIPAGALGADPVIDPEAVIAAAGAGASVAESPITRAPGDDGSGAADPTDRALRDPDPPLPLPADPVPPAQPTAESPADAMRIQLGAAASSGPTVLERGHVDLIDVTLEGDRLVIRVKDDGAGTTVHREPADVQVRVGDAARSAVPSGSTYGFLGVPGAPVWILPEVENSSLVWPGWSTSALARGQLSGDKVRLRLVGVDGPGSFAVYRPDRFGAPQVLFDRAGVSPNVVDVPVGSHAHANWSFGAEGVHRLTFRAEATLPDGRGVSADATYVVLVGDATAPIPWEQTAPPATAPPGPANAVAGPSSAADPNGADAARVAAGDAAAAALPDRAVGDPVRGSASAPSVGASDAAAASRLANSGVSSGQLTAVGLGALALGLLLARPGATRRHVSGRPQIPQQRRAT